MDTLTIKKPDDWHVHLRDGVMLKAVLPFTTARFGRAIVMPNLAPKPIATGADALAYRERILQALPEGVAFEPLMTLYLTDTTSAQDLSRGFAEKTVVAAKLYPAGATTHSDQGVTDIAKISGVLETMQEIGMPLLVHGEALRYEDGSRVDPYDREKVFIEKTLAPLLVHFPSLKVVFEHATTKDAVDFIMSDASGRLGATVTIQHLMLSRGDMFEGGLQPHLYCLPPIKREEHRDALRKAVTSGDTRFFLGTDSAPHPTHAKERASGCAAGMFTAPAALELYAQIFEEEGSLDKLEAFASLNGPRFYGMEPNTDTMTLEKKSWTLDEPVAVENGDAVRPFGYHEDAAKRLEIRWRLA